MPIAKLGIQTFITLLRKGALLVLWIIVNFSFLHLCCHPGPNAWGVSSQWLLSLCVCESHNQEFPRSPICQGWGSLLGWSRGGIRSLVWCGGMGQTVGLGLRDYLAGCFCHHIPTDKLLCEFAWALEKLSLTSVRTLTPLESSQLSWSDDVHHYLTSQKLAVLCPLWKLWPIEVHLGSGNSNSLSLLRHDLGSY